MKKKREKEHTIGEGIEPVCSCQGLGFEDYAFKRMLECLKDKGINRGLSAKIIDLLNSSFDALVHSLPRKLYINPKPQPGAALT